MWMRTELRFPRPEDLNVSTPGLRVNTKFRENPAELPEPSLVRFHYRKMIPMQEWRSLRGVAFITSALINAVLGREGFLVNYSTSAEGIGVKHPCSAR